MTQIKKTFCESALSIAVVASLGLLSLLPRKDALADESVAPAAISSPTTQGDQPSIDNQSWALHGQLTNITQKHSVFNAPYSGAQSLSPSGDAEETTDITLMAGVRLWHGAEFWINPEIDQGFGFNNTMGIAGFPNGGAYKLGFNTPYFRVPRAFIRDVFSLGGEEQKIKAAPNQLAGTETANNVVVTVGKFAVPDIFDTNSYAHDPRGDFMNWSIIEAGAFDYAADPWGYTFGAAVEWNQDWWTVRAGFFQMSQVPNLYVTGIHLNQNSTMLEAEERHHLFEHAGKVKVLAFINHANMANYMDAVRLGAETNTTPDVSQVRKIGSRPGVILNVEQELTSDIGVFARYSVNKGDKETYEFTDINQSLAAGLQIKGALWGRHDDTVGVAAVSNRLSGAAQTYFAAGGLGVLIGDGQLNYQPENIVEAYYSAQVNSYAAVTLDYQHVNNPAYNQDRGPVSIYGIRLHASF